MRAWFQLENNLAAELLKDGYAHCQVLQSLSFQWWTWPGVWPRGVARMVSLPPVSGVLFFFSNFEMWVSAFESSCFLLFPSNLKTACHPSLTPKKQGKVFSMDCFLSRSSDRVHRALLSSCSCHISTRPRSTQSFWWSSAFQTKRSLLLLRPVTVFLPQLTNCDPGPTERTLSLQLFSISDSKIFMPTLLLSLGGRGYGIEA